MTPLPVSYTHKQETQAEDIPVTVGKEMILSPSPRVVLLFRG